MSWIEDPWMGFDTETTGVRALKDRLVTAALVLRIDGASYRSGVSAPDQVATWLTDPGVEIPEQATAVHGITTEQARRDGRPIEDVLHELAGSIVEHWLRGYPVVAFNATYDITLVNQELRRHRLGSFEERLEGAPMLVVDPLVLDRKLDRFRKGKKTLTDMAPVYGAVASPDAHTAEVDVAMTLDVLAGMVDKYPQLASMSALELTDYQRQAHQDWAEDFERYLRKQGRDATIDREWPQITPRGRGDDQQ